MTAPHVTRPHQHPPLAIVVAMTRNRLIGTAGHLPWTLPDDLQLFRQITLGGTVIMGHRTYTSIGRPLARRTNIVLSRNPVSLEGVIVVGTFIEGLRAALRFGQPIFFIGGASVYRKALPLVDALHVSWVEGDYSGDLYFPEFNLDEWKPASSVDYPGFRHVRYERLKSAGKEEVLANG